MKRTILTYGGYFERFIATLDTKERRKVDYILSLMETTDRLPVKFIKLIRDGLYELRIAFGGNIYKALRLKNEYYADKRSQNKEL